MPKKKIILYFIILCALDLFSFNLLRERDWVVVETLSLLLMTPVFLSKGQGPVRKRFKRLLKYYVLGLAISVVSAFIFHQQSLLDSYGAYRGFGFVLFYFYLHKKKYTTRSLENAILVIGFIFQLIYWLQIQKNFTLFGFRWDEKSTGIERIMIGGRHIFILSYYIILSRFRLNPKLVFFLILSISTLLLLQTRQLLIPAILITLYHFKNTFFKNPFIGVSIIIIVSLVAVNSNEIIQTVLNKSLNEINAGRIGADRSQSVYYYVFEYNKNIFTRIFGEGYPTPGTKYGDEFQNLKRKYGLSPSDIGPLGWSAFLGIIWGISVLLMVYKGLRIKVPQRYIYAKYYMINVLCTLFFGEGQFVTTSSIITLMMVFYLLDKTNYELNNDDEEDILSDTDVTETAKPLAIAVT